MIFHFLKLLFVHSAGIFLLTNISCIASNNDHLAGQKDGINLYIRFAEPLSLENPKLICEFENTTETPVSFQYQGAAEGPGLNLHLFDKDGKEIEKTPEWIHLYETGDSMHTRYGVIPPGKIVGHYEIDLQTAYGKNWKSGTRLTVLWNERERRTGNGPYGGQFGIGSGLRAVLDITPITGGDTTPKLPIASQGLPDNPNDSCGGTQNLYPRPNSNLSWHQSLEVPYLKKRLVFVVLLFFAGLALWKVIRKDPSH